MRGLILARAGISLHDGKQAMVYSRLSRRLRESGHRSFGSYLAWLEAASGTAADSEWQAFVNCLTTNLTSFYRENHHFQALRDDLEARAGRLSTEKIVFVGASTGGTEAARELLMNLPPDAPAVTITQHMPAGFTKNYAARLDGLCRIRVGEARDGERVLPSHAYVAPGGTEHLGVERSGANYVARVVAGEPVNRHRPSVEMLFESAARVVGANALGIMLTGMGTDGATAMRSMRDAGSYNLVQDEASGVVFGMPREAIAAGAAHEVLPLAQIAPRLIERLRSTSGFTNHRV